MARLRPSRVNSGGVTLPETVEERIGALAQDLARMVAPPGCREPLVPDVSAALCSLVLALIEGHGVAVVSQGRKPVKATTQNLVKGQRSWRRGAR